MRYRVALLSFLLTISAYVAAGEIVDYSTAAASNNATAPAGAPEGMAPSAVNDTMREQMARTKRWYVDSNCATSSGGSANAYTLAAAATVTAYAQGQVYCFKASFANTGAATLNVDGVGAKTIKKYGTADLASGDITSGEIVLVAYDSTDDVFEMLSVPHTAGAGNFTDLTATSSFTSPGIDDNASAVALTIDSSGRLLAGHTSALTIFNQAVTQSAQVNSTSVLASGTGSYNWEATASGGGIFAAGQSRGATPGTFTVVQSGDRLAIFDGQGADGDEFQAAARMEVYVDGTPGDADMPGRIVLKTSPDGAATPTEALRIDSKQTVTMALQPAFMAVNSADDLNVTGNGTAATVDFNSETYDKGGNFAADTFTAPVTGVYHFCATVTLSGITSAADTVRLDIVAGSNTYRALRTDTNDLDSSLSINNCVMAQLTSGQTAYVQVTVVGEASDVVDIDGTATQEKTYFSGYLAN